MPTPHAPEAEMPSEAKNDEAVCEVTASNFMQEVMEPSLSQVVIIDFWAPWSGPGKQLSPILEKLVRESGGAVKLTKINIDQNPQIAQQLHVQSVPTVFAFFNRQLVDGFMGVLPESQIREWLLDLIKKTGATGISQEKAYLEEALTRAQECLESDDVVTALSIFTAILEKYPDNVSAFAGILRGLLTLGDAQQAADRLAAASPDLANHKVIGPIRTAIDLALEATKAQSTPLQPLLDRLSVDPNDHQARFDLALAHYAQDEIEQSIDGLLEIVKRDRKWQDEAARAQLVKIFESLGHAHPLTIESRKKLSTILFS